MKNLGPMILSMVSASAAMGQQVATPGVMAPVVGDFGLVVLAIGVGLGGVWGIRKYRG